MFLATYTYCYQDPNASGGKICKTITKPIITDSAEYAKRLIIEFHKENNQEIYGEIKLVGSLP